MLESFDRAFLGPRVHVPLRDDDAGMAQQILHGERVRGTSLPEACRKSMALRMDHTVIRQTEVATVASVQFLQPGHRLLNSPDPDPERCIRSTSRQQA